MVVNGLWSELGELQFSDTIWEEVEECQQKYFSGTEICGWFLRGSEEYSPDLILLKQIIYMSMYYVHTVTTLYQLTKRESIPR